MGGCPVWLALLGVGKAEEPVRFSDGLDIAGAWFRADGVAAFELFASLPRSFVCHRPLPISPAPGS